MAGGGARGGRLRLEGEEGGAEGRVRAGFVEESAGGGGFLVLFRKDIRFECQ